MAFKKTVTAQFGMVINDAYHRVDGVSIVSKDRMAFRLSVSVDGQLTEFSSFSYVCNYDILGDNPIAQAYTHLKTLPEYADAVDC